MLILSERDLRAALTMGEVIEAIEEGFRLLAAGGVRVPDRLQLEVPESNGVMLEMPAYARAPQSQDSGKASGALGTKIVSVFADNSKRGLDVVQAIYLLFDEATGAPLALMEGRFITAIRTAATSAAATKRMATDRPKRLAIFGAGVQARFHIEAMIEVADVERVMIASRTESRARALADHASSVYNVACEVVSPSEAASRTNLICACTNSMTPLFGGGLLSSGAHINAVGSFTPAMRELDAEAVQRSRVIVDEWSAAGREAGDILIPLAEGAISSDHVKGTLADVVSGKIAGRASPEEITLFKSCGLALEDLVTARLAYIKAIDMGLGSRAEI